MKLAIISDVHSNLEAFEAVLQEIEKQQIDKIYCCGDVVGYGASPSKCLKLIREFHIPSVMGNHDLAVVTHNVTWFNINAAKSILLTIDDLEENDVKFILKFPERNEVVVKDHRILMVHGSPRNPIWEYVHPTYVNSDFVKDIYFDVIVMGHTHVPFVKRIGNKLILNPGSVGQPRDSNPKASFAIIDVERLFAKIIRVDYDIEKAAQKIIKFGLPDFLALRLYSGI